MKFACSPRPCGGCHTCLGCADGKASIERLCLSPYVEKPFNSKVIKRFVPELRSRQVFFVFRDSYVLCIYVMNILSTFHILVADYVTNAQARILPGEWGTQNSLGFCNVNRSS